MKTVLITRNSVTKQFPLRVVPNSVLTGDGWTDGEMIAATDADAVNAFVGDDFASDAINFQMIDGNAMQGELDGAVTWKVEG